MTYKEFAMEIQEVDNLWECDLEDPATLELWQHSPDNPDNQ